MSSAFGSCSSSGTPASLLELAEGWMLGSERRSLGATPWEEKNLPPVLLSLPGPAAQYSLDDGAFTHTEIFGNTNILCRDELTLPVLLSLLVRRKERKNKTG